MQTCIESASRYFNKRAVFFIFHTVAFTLFHFLTLNSDERLEDFQGHIVKEQVKTVHWSNWAWVKWACQMAAVRDRFAHVRCSNFFPAWKSSWSNAVIILALQSFVNNWALSVSSWKAMVWYSNEFRTTGAKRFHLFTCTLR